MRRKRRSQRGLDFSASNLKITNEYYARYEAVSTVLDQTPKLLDLIHNDLKRSLDQVNREARGRRPKYTTDNVLRILICQVLEDASLREIVVRIDDSNFLRRFARIDNGPMMDYTTLCKLKNAIDNNTWKAVNRCLAQYAVQSGNCQVSCRMISTNQATSSSTLMRRTRDGLSSTVVMGDQSRVWPVQRSGCLLRARS